MTREALRLKYCRKLASLAGWQEDLKEDYPPEYVATAQDSIRILKQELVDMLNEHPWLEDQLLS